MPDATAWKEKAAALRHSAIQQRCPEERQTLLMLAEDCEAIAAELAAEAQQPGKPKPPGNPPRPPREGPAPIQEPPRPTPPPPVEPPPPPVRVAKLQRSR